MPTTTSVYVDPDTGIEITATTDDNGSAPSKAKVDQVVQALKELPPAVKKIIADTGFKKINVGPINDRRAVFDPKNPFVPLPKPSGWTPDCPLFGFPDISLDQFNRNRPESLSHESGHALDDALGEQNGQQHYRESDAFKQAFNADNASFPENRVFVKCDVLAF